MSATSNVAWLARSYRDGDPDFVAWARGYGVITHDDATQVGAYELAELLISRGQEAGLQWVLKRLQAADHVASAAMLLVVHLTYARSVDLTRGPLQAIDFKPSHEGCGSLNMLHAYVGYLLANVLTGTTRSWSMGRGHCAAAIEAVNVLVGNLSPTEQGRYDPQPRALRALRGISIPSQLPQTVVLRCPLAAMSPNAAGGICGLCPAGDLLPTRR